MPFVAGGAPGTPPDGPPYAPRPSLPPSKNNFKKLRNLETSFSGPRLAIFMVFFHVFWGSVLRSPSFPSL